MESVYDLMDLTVWISHNDIEIESKNCQRIKNLIPENRDLLLSIFNETNIGAKFDSYNTDTLNQFGVNLHVFKQFIVRYKKWQPLKVFQKTNVEIRDKYFKKFKKTKNQTILHYTEEKKCQDQIHPAQIRNGFRTFLFRIISRELIGNDRNQKKILKTLHNFLKISRTEAFSLKNLINKINISSIKWLDAVKDEKTRCILAAKFIKWLFHFFIKVIKSQFYVKSNYEEKVFIFIDDWDKKKKKEVHKLFKKLILQSDYSVTPGSIIPTGNKLRIFLKRDSVRFIVSNNYKDTEKNRLRKALAILRYLYEEHLKMNDTRFEVSYYDVCKTLRNYKSCHVISADIYDAYGSINQVKLCDILQQLFEYLPDKIHLQSYMLKGIKKYKYHSIGKINIGNTSCIEFVEKSLILKTIKDYILFTKITVHEKEYNLCKGLAQGLMLSSILCSIYYSHMAKKYFSDFMKSGFLFTYVDDSLYITDDENVAKKYLNVIKKGIPEYNCWFNKSKLQSSLENTSRNINFLGWEINPRSLEVKPKYVPVRKNTIFMKLSNNTFQTKIERLTPLKMKKIIFSKRINSVEHIFKNIEILALQQARRCYTLSKAICETNHKLSISMIRRANIKIIRKIRILTDWDMQEYIQYSRKLRYIIWKSFFSVFKKYNDFLSLTKQLQKLTKKNKTFYKQRKV